MPTFRKRPIYVDAIDIEAIQFTGDNLDEIWKQYGQIGIYGMQGVNAQLFISTPTGGSTWVRPGDWIVKEDKPNTFSTIEPVLFESEWEPVAEPGAEDARAWQANFQAMHARWKVTEEERLRLKDELSEALQKLHYRTERSD